MYEQSFSALKMMTREQWKLRMEGQLFSFQKELQVTGFEELRAYIDQHLQGMQIWEEADHGS